MVVWLFPAIRHFKRKYFLFFLLLALADPINMLHLLFVGNNSNFLFSITSLLMIACVLEKSYVKKFIIPITIFLLLTTIICIINNNRNLHYIIILVSSATVLLVFLKDFILIYVDSRKINLFLVVLIFYISTNLFKFLNVLLGFSDATAFFIITSIAQIAFGLFFSIFREDNPRLLV